MRKQLETNTKMLKMYLPQQMVAPRAAQPAGLLAISKCVHNTFYALFY